MAEKHTQKAETSESRITEHMRAVEGAVTLLSNKSKKGIEGFLRGLIVVLGTQACAPQLPPAGATPDTSKEKPLTLTMIDVLGRRGGNELWSFSDKVNTPWGQITVRGHGDILADDPLKKATINTITFPIETKEVLGDRMIFVMGVIPRDKIKTPEDKKMFVVQVSIKKEGDTYLAQQFSDEAYEKTPISMVAGIEAGYNSVIVVTPDKEQAYSILKLNDFERKTRLYLKQIPDGKNIVELAKEFKKDAVAFEVSFEDKKTKKIE